MFVLCSEVVSFRRQILRHSNLKLGPGRVVGSFQVPGIFGLNGVRAAGMCRGLAVAMYPQFTKKGLDPRSKIPRGLGPHHPGDEIYIPGQPKATFEFLAGEQLGTEIFCPRELVSRVSWGPCPDNRTNWSVGQSLNSVEY